MLSNTLFRTLINDYSKIDNINIDTFDKYLINLNLCNEFHNHNVNGVKGFVFEYITKYNYLQKNLEVYRFNEIPIDVRKSLNLGMKDLGIDIIYKENDEWITVQCKWSSKTNLTINKNQILGFIEEAKQFNNKVLVTNVCNKNKYIQERYNIDWILRKDFEKIINRNFINFIINEIKFKPIAKKHENFALRNCQKEALISLTNSELTKKQCIMFCGTGKSIVMIEYIKSKNCDRIVVLMPSLQLINQFYNNLKQFVNREILCICSKFDRSSLTGDEVDDNQGNDLLAEYLKLESTNIIYTTKPTIIAQKLKQDKLIVLCTYQSSPLLKNYKFNLGLFDEAHKTVGNSFGFAVHNKNCHIDERIFFTATPKYYKGKAENCISMCDENIYGKEVYNYSYSQAKNDNYVLDFEIITYIVPKNMEDLVNETYIKKDNLNVKTEVLIGALILAQHITNSKKTLTYHNTIENAVDYKKTLAYVFAKHDINSKIFTMCGNTKMEKRNEIFSEYESSETAVICSSRVLGEGIDLPCTDTINFVDPRSSTIDVTQCFGRGVRIGENKKKCSVIIPIHYNQIDGKHNYSDLIKILSAVSEIDNKLIANFVNNNENNKIRIVHMNIDNINNENIDVKYNIEDIMKEMSLAIIDSRILCFDYKMNLLFKYCNDKYCVPPIVTKYENVNIGEWLYTQKRTINNVDNELYKKLSVNEYVKDNIDKYLKWVEDNKDKEKLDWTQSQQLLFEYCDTIKCSPKMTAIYKNHNVGSWLHCQKSYIHSVDDTLYKKLSVNKYVKENLDKYLTDVEINKNKNKLDWEQSQQLLFKCSNNMESAPKKRTIYETHKIGRWLDRQKKNINSIDDDLYKKLSVNKYVKESLDEYLKKTKKNENKI